MALLFNKVIKNSFFLSLLFFSLTINAFDWVPKQDFIDGKKGHSELLEKIVKQEPITYCIDEEISPYKPAVTVYIRNVSTVTEPNKSYDTFEVEYTLQMWFDNVLKRGKKYPNFEKEFSDILTILKQPVKMKKVTCSSSSYVYDFADFSTQQKGYKFNSEKEDLRVFFASFETVNKVSAQYNVKDKTAGMYIIEPDRKELWVAKRGMFEEKTTLLHELGHMLGLADVSYDEEKQAKEYGSESKKTIMANDISYLTCDDADGLVAMLYLVLNKDKVFKSFCPGNIFYHNGKLLPMPDLDNPEGLRKYSLFSELEKDLLFK